MKIKENQRESNLQDLIFIDFHMIFQEFRCFSLVVNDSHWFTEMLIDVRWQTDAWKSKNQRNQRNIKLTRQIFYDARCFSLIIVDSLVFIDSLKFEGQFRSNLSSFVLISRSFWCPNEIKWGQWFWNWRDQRIISRFLSEIGFYGF